MSVEVRAPVAGTLVQVMAGIDDVVEVKTECALENNGLKLKLSPPGLGEDTVGNLDRARQQTGGSLLIFLLFLCEGVCVIYGSQPLKLL